RLRYLAAVALDDGGAGPADGARLLTEEAGGPDQLLQLLWRERQVVGGGGAAPKQRGRDEIDARVGALCGEDRRHQQLQRRGEVECDARIRVLGRKAVEQQRGALAPCVHAFTSAGPAHNRSSAGQSPQCGPGVASKRPSRIAATMVASPARRASALEASNDRTTVASGRSRKA